MGLLLLIPGILFLANGTEWFSGEDSIGVALTAIGAVLILLQIAWGLYVASKIKSTHQEISRSFGDPNRVVARQRRLFDINDYRR